MLSKQLYDSGFLWSYQAEAIMSALITPTLYPKPQDFDIMQPKYDVSPEQMADYFMEVIATRKK